ncbi:hypothetical protein AGMMS49957_08640 [Synergistales bacterium]|nr:hypothetical protein AGMMS49957_08640 [Synergistales bacterium]
MCVGHIRFSKLRKTLGGPDSLMYPDDVSCNQCLAYIKSAFPFTVALFDSSGGQLGCTNPDESLTAHRLFLRCKENIDPVGVAADSGVTLEYYSSGELTICCLLFTPNPPESALPYIRALLDLSIGQRELRERFESDFSERLYFINQLTAINEKNEENIASMALQLKYNPSLTRASVLFEIDRRKPVPGNFREDRVKKHLRRALANAPGFSEEDIFGILDIERFVVFKTIGLEEHIEKNLTGFACSIIDDLLTTCGLHLIAGAGSAYGNMSGLRSSYAESKFVMSNFSFLEQGASLIFVNRHLFEYFSSLLDNGYMAEKFEGYSQKLHDSPATLETLIALSKNNSSPKRAADDLGIHRNTAMQRYAKLKELLEIDPLNNDRDRLEIRQYALYHNRKTLLHAGIIIQEGSALHAGCRKFSEIVAQYSNNSIALDVHTISHSGNNRMLLDILKSGSIDIIFCDTNTLIPYTGGRIAVLDLPFLFDSPEEAYAVLDGKAGQSFVDDLRSYSLIGLCFWSTGFRHISTKDRFIRHPGDLKGLKIRIMNKDIMEAYFRLVGAVPIKIDYSDVYTSLKQRLVDGQENPYSNFLGMKFYECQSVVSEISLSFSIAALLTTQATWQKLSEAQRNVIIQSAKEATIWQRGELDRMNENCKRLIESYGVKIFPLSEQPMDLWKQSAKPLYDQFQFPEMLDDIEQIKRRHHAQRIR